MNPWLHIPGTISVFPPRLKFEGNSCHLLFICNIFVHVLRICYFFIGNTTNFQELYNTIRAVQGNF